jgi:hypothetical protein
MLVIHDDARSCCEERFLDTDDDLSYFIGSKLIGFEERDVEIEKEDDHDECHEVTFIEVETSKGSFTVQAHNQHNGYYGGIFLKAMLKEKVK